MSDQPQAVCLLPGEDAALVAAVLRKDRKATAEFVARYADGLYGYVRSRLAPQHDQVEDLVQEVFLAAWENLTQYRGIGSLQAWVIGIARHKVEDYYRERLRAPESIEDAEPDPSTSEPGLDFHQLLEQDELRKNTWRVMGGLPEQYRLALIWRYWEKASAREMAMKTGKTEKRSKDCWHVPEPNFERGGTMSNLPDEQFMEWIAAGVEPTDSEVAPARLKARVYSALMLKQAETGPLMSLNETNACGSKLCIFEQLVRIAPLGERTNSFNICRVCHARVLAEHIENAPIYWRGCPYVELKNS